MEIKEDVNEKEETNVKENIKENEEIPTFTPPKEDEIPTFTPPEDDIPTFTAPTGETKFDGPACKNHPNHPAVAQCARCGENICKECAETCSVSGGEYAGKYLCFDCCKALFDDDKKELSKNRNKVMIQYIITLIGVIIGGAIGASGGSIITVIIFAAIGGSLLVALKPIFSALGDAISGIVEAAAGGSILSGIIQFLVGVVKFLIVAVQCIIRTSIKLTRYTIYLVKANKAINSDKEALKELQDFMTYMDVRARKPHEDIAKLMQEGGELYNNSYAKLLVEKGEEVADQMLRVATTRIAENGEIIRTFVTE